PADFRVTCQYIQQIMCWGPPQIDQKRRTNNICVDFADIRTVSSYDSAALKICDAFTRGTTRQSNTPRQRFQRNTRLFRQDCQYFTIFRIKFAHLYPIHMAGHMSVYSDKVPVIPTGYLMPENPLHAKLRVRNVTWKNTDYDRSLPSCSPVFSH